MARSPNRLIVKKGGMENLLKELSSSSPDRIMSAARKIPALYSKTRNLKLKTLVLDRLLVAYNSAVSKLRKSIPHAGEMMGKEKNENTRAQIVRKIMQQVKITKQIRAVLEKLGYTVPLTYLVFTPRPDSSERLFLPARLTKNELRPKTKRIKLKVARKSSKKPAEKKSKPIVAGIHPLLRMRTGKQMKPAKLVPLTDADLAKYLEKNPKPPKPEWKRWRETPAGKAWAKAVPNAPRGFAFDLSGKPLKPLDTYAELMKRRGQKINPAYDFIRRRFIKYRKIKHAGVLLLFPFDLAAGIIEGINRGGTWLLAPALAKLEGDLGDQSKRKYYKRLAQNRAEMKRFYAQALKTGVASITFVNTLIVDRDILSMDDIKLLKKIVQNRQNSKQVRLAALYRLEKLGKKHISFFISLVNDKKLENELRSLAGYALLRINTKEAITALRKHRVIYIGALATQAEHDKDKTAMGKMDYVMRSSKYTVGEKIAAASALTILGKKKGLGFLARSLGHKNPNVAAMASGSLMRLSWRSDVQEAVIAKLKAPDPDTRIIAIFTLSNAINKKVVRSIAPKLSDKDKKVCTIAAKAMGELAFRGMASLESSEEAAGRLANNKLSKMYNKGGDAKIIASIGLLEQEDKRATKGIMLGITHRSPYLRSTCAVAIPDLLKKRMITASKARSALLPLLKDPSEEVRIVATLALGYISRRNPSELIKMRPKKKMD